MPYRLEVGPRDVAAGQGVLVRRVDRDKQAMSLDALPAELPNLLADYQKMLFQRALDFRAANTHMADTYDEFKADPRQGGRLPDGAVVRRRPRARSRSTLRRARRSASFRSTRRTSRASA